MQQRYVNDDDFSTGLPVLTLLDIRDRLSSFIFQNRARCPLDGTLFARIERIRAGACALVILFIGVESRDVVTIVDGGGATYA